MVRAKSIAEGEGNMLGTPNTRKTHRTRSVAGVALAFMGVVACGAACTRVEYYQNFIDGPNGPVGLEKRKTPAPDLTLYRFTSRFGKLQRVDLVRGAHLVGGEGLATLTVERGEKTRVAFLNRWAQPPLDFDHVFIAGATPIPVAVTATRSRWAVPRCFTHICAGCALLRVHLLAQCVACLLNLFDQASHTLDVVAR